MQKHSSRTTGVEYRNMDFVGYSKYEVGNDGSVWSLVHKTRQRITGRVSPGGHTLVKLWNLELGRQKDLRVDRVVLEAFVGVSPPGADVEHINENRADDKLSNLRWKSPETNDDEVWKDVPGYEGFYQVSDLGQVKSLAKKVSMSDGRTYTVREKLLKPTWRGRYFYVMFSNSGKEITNLVHRLVLLAFAGPCPEGMECRHLDGNSKNNQLKNLKWGTKKDNGEDRVRHGTSKGAHPGEEHHNAKLSAGQVREIRKRARNGERPCNLAREFVISESIIRRIRDGMGWKSISDE